MNIKDYSKHTYYLLFIIVVLLSGFVLKILSSVIIPIIFAGFLSFMLIPAVKFLNQKTKLPWAFLSVMIVIILLVTIVFVTYFLSIGITTIVQEYPKYEIEFSRILEIIAQQLHMEFDKGKSSLQNLFIMGNLSNYIQEAAVTVSTSVVNALKSIFIVLLLLLFLLLETKAIKKKVLMSTNEVKRNQYLSFAKEITSEVVHYLSIKFLISFTTGTLVFITCLLFGLKFAIVWGFTAFIMNFIPTFGSIFSVAITTIFAILDFYPSWGKIALLLVFMILVNFLLGNILEPRIEGKHLGLSTFVIIVFLIFFGFIWGFIGMIIAVPLTVIIKIVCEHISFLHPIAILLSDDPDATKQNLKTLD